MFRLTLPLCAVLLPAVACAGPPGPGAVGGTAKPANAPVEAPAVPGRGDRITVWQQAAALPWVEAVDVAGLALPDGDAFRGATPPALVMDNAAAEFTVSLDLSGGETVVLLSPEAPAGFSDGLPDGPTKADYARLALGNPDRLARARPQLTGADMVQSFEAENFTEVLLGPGGRLPVAKYVVLFVMPDWTTSETNDVIVSTGVTFSADVKGGPRIISYNHGAFGTPPEQLERWVWRSPADDPAPPAADAPPDADDAGTDGEAGEPVAALTTGLPGADASVPRFVRVREASGESTIMMAP